MFRMALKKEEIERALASVDRFSNNWVQRSAQRETVDPVREIGTQLFSALFEGGIGEIYRTASNQALSAGTGLRLRLIMRDAAVARLPSEFLYDPLRRDFVALSVETSIVRQWQEPLLRPFRDISSLLWEHASDSAIRRRTPSPTRRCFADQLPAPEFVAAVLSRLIAAPEIEADRFVEITQKYPRPALDFLLARLHFAETGGERYRATPLAWRLTLDLGSLADEPDYPHLCGTLEARARRDQPTAPRLGLAFSKCRSPRTLWLADPNACGNRTGRFMGAAEAIARPATFRWFSHCVSISRNHAGISPARR